MANTPAYENAEQILEEIIATISLPVLLSGKKFGAKALDEFKVDLLKKIKQRIDGGHKWAGEDGARMRVLPIALALGTISGILAHRNPTVEKIHFDAAFEAIRSAEMCTPFKKNGEFAGLGLWCDF